MLSREEYEDGVIRMYDSIRSSMHKGKEDCEGVSCVDCPLNGVCDDAANAFDMIEVVEKWVKKHPIKTNADKFKEVFGLDMAPQISSCINFKEKCADCKYYDYNDFKCDANKRFWNAEYKGKTEGCEEE